ncbi:hypothetical protein [Algicella marina]|uniref:Uncharacterized protein n=1 Tax=Algicella marina TaxID=2683284 RepID=A0A6P1T673_9RHOB|nr:hypothetical protein [Algicella marina]QHQ36976.1 hypothetical protein GO499_18215 [Algicella marina]
MPLTILVPLVVGGILGIVFIVHMSGWTGRLTLDDHAVRRAWAGEYPDDEPTRVALSDDARAALLTTKSGARGVVWCMGDGIVLRRFQPQGVRVEETSDGLRLRFRDTGAPAALIRLADAGSRAEWTAPEQQGRSV